MGHSTASHLSTDTSCLVPGELISTPVSWDLETALFAERSHLVAWAGELTEPGDYVARDIGTVPLLLCRQDDGTITARVNVCSHQAARVAVGCGNAERFVCHRHGWVYDRSGNVASRPGPVGSPLKLSGRPLRAVTVAVLGGQVVVRLGGDDRLPDAPPLALPDDGDSGVRPAEQRPATVDADWKLVLAAVAVSLDADREADAELYVVSPGTVVVVGADHRLLVTIAPGVQPAEARVHVALSVRPVAGRPPEPEGEESWRPLWTACWHRLQPAFDAAVAQQVALGDQASGADHGLVEVHAGPAAAVLREVAEQVGARLARGEGTGTAQTALPAL